MPVGHSQQQLAAGQPRRRSEVSRAAAGMAMADTWHTSKPNTAPSYYTLPQLHRANQHIRRSLLASLSSADAAATTSLPGGLYTGGCLVVIVEPHTCALLPAVPHLPLNSQGFCRCIQQHSACFGVVLAGSSAVLWDSHCPHNRCAWCAVGRCAGTLVGLVIPCCMVILSC